MRISDWSSDVCSSDLLPIREAAQRGFCAMHGGRYRPALRLRADEAQNVVDQNTGIDRLGYNLQLACFCLREVENVVDQVQKVDGGRMDVGRIGDRKSTRLNSSH